MTLQPSSTPLISRPLADERDWWRVRTLLIETFPLTGPGFNWELRHWDGNRHHNPGPSWQPELYARHQLWETTDGVLAGVAHPEGDSEAWFEIHPQFRAQLEPLMLDWAEQHFSGPAAGGGRELQLCVYEYDAPRIRLLQARGFEKQVYGWITRRMHLGRWPTPPVPEIAPGYSLRTTRSGDLQDCQRIATLLNAAFNRPGFHQALEVFNFCQNSPSFTHHLNLVAEAPDGEFGAHAGLTIDSANRFAIFEPVCTHPDPRRKRLAQTLMLEGLRRLQALGVEEVEVSTGDADAANALYDSLGFTEYYKAYYWKKLYG